MICTCGATDCSCPCLRCAAAREFHRAEQETLLYSHDRSPEEVWSDRVAAVLGLVLIAIMMWMATFS